MLFFMILFKNSWNLGHMNLNKMYILSIKVFYKFCTCSKS